jgi:hypothetical protein
MAVVGNKVQGDCHMQVVENRGLEKGTGDEISGSAEFSGAGVDRVRSAIQKETYVS